jgi:molybdate transport system regulatory protein
LDNGSLSQAARTLGMSYRRTWLRVENVNACFDTPVPLATTGGEGGGGVGLTKFGALLIARYHELSRDIETAAARRLRPITRAPHTC